MVGDHVDLISQDLWRRGRWQPIVEVDEDVHALSPEVFGYDLDNPGECAGGCREAKREAPEAEVLVSDGETQPFSGGRMDGHVEVGVLQIQTDAPPVAL